MENWKLSKEEVTNLLTKNPRLCLGTRRSLKKFELLKKYGVGLEDVLKNSNVLLNQKISGNLISIFKSSS